MRAALATAVLTIAAATTGAEDLREVKGGGVGELKKEYPFIRFATLAGYEYPMPDPSQPPADVPIPADVKTLDRSKVSVRGYMVPLEFERGTVGRFILSASIDACHFGMVGKPNEWIMVEVAGGRRTRSAGFSPVTVFGVLSVGTELKRNRLASVYRMKADAIAFH